MAYILQRIFLVISLRCPTTRRMDTKPGSRGNHLQQSLRWRKASIAAYTAVEGEFFCLESYLLDFAKKRFGDYKPHQNIEQSWGLEESFPSAQFATLQQRTICCLMLMQEFLRELIKRALAEGRKRRKKYSLSRSVSPSQVIKRISGEQDF